MFQQYLQSPENPATANLSGLAVKPHLFDQDKILRYAAKGELQRLTQSRLDRAKPSYTVRNVPILDVAVSLLNGDIEPRPGDMVLARIDRLGQHKRIELPSGRRATLHVGDEVILCYADRYAPDQFEARVPDSLKPCSMVAAGGIAADVISRHSARRRATAITPQGLLADHNGNRLNLGQYTLQELQPKSPLPRVLVVVGTSMNAGKTTTAAYLIKGLTSAGCKVGAAKLTGTGAGGDRWLMLDSGACRVLDFTDVGMASTCHVPCEQLIQSSKILITQLQQSGADTVVLEIADGLLQHETACLLQSHAIQKLIDGVLFASGDAMGALAGSQWLLDHGLPCIALGGAFTASDLACQEAAVSTGLPVLVLSQLADPSVATFIDTALSDSEQVNKAV